MVKKTKHLSKQHHSIKKPGSFIEGLFTKAGWSGSGICPCGMDPGCTALRIKTGVWRPARGRSSNEHIRTLPTRTLVAPNSIPLNPESCCSPKLKLLFSYCERLFHLDLATVMDHDVLERFISPIFLCVLNLSHHILEDSKQLALE